jgi:CBS domain-containing protein
MHRTIGELATRPVITVETDMLVVEALKLMSARRISCLVVLLNTEPVGILTERDVVFAANWVIGQPSLRIREVMSKPVLTAPATATVADAYLLFRENQVRHLVVLDEQQDLAGIFTRTDLVRALKEPIFAEIPNVASLMSSRVWQVASHVSARHALALMASHAISGVVVVDDGCPVGVFTERDAVRLVAAGTDLSSLPVSAVMTSPVVTIPVATTPSRAIDLMCDREVRRLLVLDQHGDLAGVLTQTDLCRIMDNPGGGEFDRLARAAAVSGQNCPQSLH